MLVETSIRCREILLNE